MAHYQCTATMITAAGNPKPANAERGGEWGRNRATDLIGQPLPDHQISRHNSAGLGPAPNNRPRRPV
jgi:hypothetical protein